ncbi:MAG: CoA-binding protein, partial [Deltaproteobacteria bacterium]|nr:CoA-binding protein [Deltaproteobacteria bacterium]
MSIYNLEKMFRPESVAIVGASEKKGSVGFAIMQNIIQGKYSGDIYPINPNFETIWDRPACATLSDINTAIDLAVIAVPIKTVPAIIKECVGIGVSGAVIVSAWKKEKEAKGIELEAAIRKEAEDAGLRIIGPGSQGIINCQLKLNAGLSNHMSLPGKMAFVSQSGGISTSILDLSIKEHIGFSYFVSLGSMLDVDFGDIIDYLGGDPYVSSILLYVESFTKCRNFMSAARAVSRIKPIIVLKAGRSRDGALAAYPYTSELAGEDAVYDAAFKRAGIVRVRTFEELFDCAELLAKQPRISGHGIAIITNAGGPGVMASDFLSDYGMEPVKLNPETISKLDEVLPRHWSQSNPVDISDDA